MKKILFITILILLMGCIKGGPRYTYDNVYISLDIEGSPTNTNWKYTQYKINNNIATYKVIDWQGKTIFDEEGKIPDEEYKKLGEKIVDAGIFTMAENMISKTAGQIIEENSAAYKISIDHNNKSIVIKPYNERYISGNLRRINAEIKRIIQTIKK